MAWRDTGSEQSVIALARSALSHGRQALTENDLATALRWLDRAHRLVPADPNAALALASACLTADPARAEALFARVAERYDVCQAWSGLAAARLRMGRPSRAADAIAQALSRHVLTPEVTALAGRIATQAGHAGWCALTAHGQVHAAATGAVQVRLDGRPVRGSKLPRGWSTGRLTEILADGIALLGSPIRIDAIRAIAGCIEPRGNGIVGWAWHPRDPDTHPALTLTDASGHHLRAWVADDETIAVPDSGPLARPRAVRIPAEWLPAGSGPFHVRGPDGRDLPGSPVDPAADQAAHVAAALNLAALYPAGPARSSAPTPAAAVLRADAPAPAHPVGADRRRRQVSIVIPVHEGGPIVLACLDSVLDVLPDGVRIVVVDDGSRDPALVTALDDLARRGTITLLRHVQPRGFPASANAGILAARGRDVVLLNSDTLVPPRWIERLSAAAYANSNIGTVTPLSNEASILSYPGPAGTNPRPDQATTNWFDRQAARANRDAITDIPVGVGFCLYLRRDCLNVVGLFRADLFAQGYGEETDFCLRARRLGWRNVALTGLFIGHLGGQSFGDAAVHLQRRNSRLIEQLHPGYQTLIDAFLSGDPLAEPRRRIDTLAWRERGREWRSAAILVTHDDGGGVEQRLRDSADAHAQAGRRPVILRPAKASGGGPAIAVRDGVNDDLPNLVFAMPAELPALLRFLRAAEPDVLEVHHLLGYHPAVYDLVTQLGVPYAVHVHDYAWFCPRVVLIGGQGHYCGEPDLPDCEACVTDHGHFWPQQITVAALRERSAAVLAAAKQVLTPSEDTGSRMRRHFPGLKTETMPHADDAASAACRTYPAPRTRARPLVGVVGGIGVHKGYDVLLACARDARRRDLDIGFVVVGHTIGDDRLMATGRVFVTGAFQTQDAVGLIVEHQPDLGFVPSVCPETWCLSLDDLWRAGLAAVAFDIGAPAERIRRTGRGFLLPLGLSTSAINDLLIAAARTAKQS